MPSRRLSLATLLSFLTAVKLERQVGAAAARAVLTRNDGSAGTYAPSVYVTLVT